MHRGSSCRRGPVGIGVSAVDYDADGFTDLYITNYGTNTLYRNRGDGTFDDLTKAAGLEAPGLNTIAVWFDYNGDGRCTSLSAISFATTRASKSPAWKGTSGTTVILWRMILGPAACFISSLMGPSRM